MQVSHTVSAVFDDRNLIGHAALAAVLQLAQRAGLHDLLGAQLTVRSPNPVAKSTSVVAGMLCGADSIDDLDVIRHGGMSRLFDDARAPSTLARSCGRSRSATSGSWTRSTPGCCRTWPGWSRLCSRVPIS